MTFTPLFAAALLRGFIMQPNPIMMIIRIGLQHLNPGGLIRLGVPSLSQVVITEITTLYHMITNLNINAFYTNVPFLNPYGQLQRAIEGFSLWGRPTSNIGHSRTSQMYQDREARGSTSPRSMTAGHVVNQLSGMIIPGVVVTSQYVARCMENLFQGVILGGLERGTDVEMNVPNGVVLSSALSNLCFGGLGNDAADGDAYFVGLAVAVGINGNEDYEARLSGLVCFVLHSMFCLLLSIITLLTHSTSSTLFSTPLQNSQHVIFLNKLLLVPLTYRLLIMYSRDRRQLKLFVNFSLPFLKFLLTWQNLSCPMTRMSLFLWEGSSTVMIVCRLPHRHQWHLRPWHLRPLPFMLPLPLRKLHLWRLLLKPLWSNKLMWHPLHSSLVDVVIFGTSLVVFSYMAGGVQGDD